MCVELGFQKLVLMMCVYVCLFVYILCVECLCMNFYFCVHPCSNAFVCVCVQMLLHICLCLNVIEYISVCLCLLVCTCMYLHIFRAFPCLVLCVSLFLRTYLLVHFHVLVSIDAVREAFVANGALELLVKILRENVDNDDDPMMFLSHSLRALENIGKLSKCL